MSRIVKVVLPALAVALIAAVPASASSAPYEPDQVIVKLRGADQSSVAGRLGLGRALSTVYGTTAKVFQVSGDPAAVAARLERSSQVAYAEPNFILHTLATPNDPLFSQEYGLNNTGQTGGTADADIDAPEGWSAAGLGAFPNSGGVKVGIVDTGIQTNHPDLAGKVANCGRVRTSLLGGTSITSGCSDDNGHGTHTSGTITANTNNGVGVAGVAFNSQLAVCKALNALGTGSTAGVASCIRWVHDRGAKVISMSLGGGASSTLQSAVNYAWANGGTGGSVLVAAAGNDGNSHLNYPAAYSNVVSVGATDANDHHASFSNTNGDVEVSAPGVSVLSTYSNGGYSTLSGTSMATPHAAGVTAIIWDRNPGATASSVVAKLDAATDDLGPAGRDTSFGFGRVNLNKAASG